MAKDTQNPDMINATTDTMASADTAGKKKKKKNTYN